MENEPSSSSRDVNELIQIFVSRFGNIREQWSPEQVVFMDEIMKIGDKGDHGLLQDSAVPSPPMAAELSYTEFHKLMDEMDRL
jgi:hypothetical protein